MTCVKNGCKDEGGKDNSGREDGLVMMISLIHARMFVKKMEVAFLLKLTASSSLEISRSHEICVVNRRSTGSVDDNMDVC